jgi:Cu-Zn family superoxide dismutase
VAVLPLRLLVALSPALLAACGATMSTTTTTGDTLNVPGPSIFTPGPDQAIARLVSKNGSASYGIVTFRQRGDKVTVAATVWTLDPGPHSFYIHENGNCSSPNAASAGPVWNAAPPGAKRSGQLPELYVGTDGNAQMQATITGVSIGDHKPTDIVGRAVVVHATLDPDPKPEFGVRNGWLACGVIVQGSG